MKVVLKKIIKNISIYLALINCLICVLGTILVVMYDNFYDIFNSFFTFLLNHGIGHYQIGAIMIIPGLLAILFYIIATKITITFDEW
ncbi:MAG: hypothetical protein GX638_04080 [Crenarchaeota archaeon]|nr:hypothetical protein [Thermoproteota archaeon]